MVMVSSIMDATKIDAVLEAAYIVVRRQIGIVTVSDVQVVRSEHF